MPEDNNKPVETETSKATETTTDQTPETVSREAYDKSVKQEKNLRERLQKLETERESEKQKALEAASLEEKLQILQGELEATKGEAEASKQQLREATLKNQLNGKVVDVDDALVIAERLGLVGEDGVDVTKLLEQKPHLAPAKTNVGGGNRPVGTDAETPKGINDLKGKSPQWIKDHWASITSK